MPGFILGAATALGVVALLRRRRYGCGPRGHHRHGHCGPGERDHDHDGDHDRGPRRGRGGWGWHRWLASRLEATPEQEKVIRDEVEGFMERARGLRREMWLGRDDVAKAMRGDAFDEEVLGGGFARQDEQIQDVRKALVGALARIHDVLDERQRRRLAEILERGPGRGWF